MRQSKNDQLTDMITSAIERSMQPQDWESYLPDWADAVLDTIVSEFRGHIGDAVYKSVKAWKEQEKKQQDTEIKDLKTQIRDLQKKLKTYELIDNAFKEAQKV